MFALFITWFPLLNLIAVPILAITSRNPSKKNFYKALIIFMLLFLSLHIIVLIALLGPDFVTVIRERFEF